MEEVKKLCEIGAPIALKSDWEEKEDAINQISKCGYVQIRNVCEEAMEESTEEEYVLFVKVERPRDSVSLNSACRQGRELLICEDLAEEHKEILESWGYRRTSETQVVEGAALVHLKKVNQSSGKVHYAEEAEPELSDLSRDEAWTPLQSHNMSNAWDTHNDYTVTAQALNVIQAVLINIVLHPFGVIDNAHYTFKLAMPAVEVGIPLDKFLQKDSCLGFFPDFIQIVIEPQWADKVIPIFEQQGAAIGNSVIHTAGSTVEGRVGYHGNQIGGSFNSGRQWADSTETVAFQRQGRNVNYEWKLERWADGNRYKRERALFRPRLMGRIPVLPFGGGTTPALEGKLPAATWMLPLAKARDHLTFKVHLKFAMQFIYLIGKLPVLSPDSIRHEFNFSDEFSVPPFESIPSYIS